MDGSFGRFPDAGEPAATLAWLQELEALFEALAEQYAEDFNPVFVLSALWFSLQEPVAVPSTKRHVPMEAFIMPDYLRDYLSEALWKILFLLQNRIDPRKADAAGVPTLSDSEAVREVTRAFGFLRTTGPGGGAGVNVFMQARKAHARRAGALVKRTALRDGVRPHRAEMLAELPTGQAHERLAAYRRALELGAEEDQADRYLTMPLCKIHSALARLERQTGVASTGKLDRPTQ